MATAFSGSSTSSIRLLRDVDSFARDADLVGVPKVLTARLLRAGRTRDAADAIAGGQMLHCGPVKDFGLSDLHA